MWGDEMGVNIYYDIKRTENALMQIEQMIITDFLTKKNEYDHVIGLFSKSQCEHTEAIKELLIEEQNTVNKITDMFKEMVRMLREASLKVEQVEEHYSDEHVTTN